MTHQEKIEKWIGQGKIGTEIGAGNSPLPGLDPRPIYVDCFEEFGPMNCLADYYGHACSLPFRDHSLDYILASHVLEHVANPIAALVEWVRVLRHGGIIYMIVPDRRVTWDRNRAVTTVDHLLADYAAGVTAADATHIDDFVNDVVWSEWCPNIPADEVPGKKTEIAQIMHASVAAGHEINIHFHTFDPDNFRALLERLGTRTRAQEPIVPRLRWEIVDFTDRFPSTSPNGILAVLRVHKGWHAHAEGEVLRLRALGDPKVILRDDAQPFAEWAAARARARAN
jgi:SAM-dependent methyltransferase